jgi:RHS repeat-associated protein
LGGLPGQAPGNYQYDATETSDRDNLVRDVSENITAIDWTVYGKVATVQKTTGNVTYLYDPAGQRVAKTANGVTTHYIRDASGNVMAIYENGALKELPIYGSSRLGVYRVLNGDLQNDRNKLILGRREYELSNHLGNVLATVSDVKLPAARVLSFTDYYAFGGAMPGRSGGSYRYGFNGKENDGETGWQDYGTRLYNPRVARFFSPDPLIVQGQQYPELSSYQFASNTPVWAIDLDGLEATGNLLRFNPMSQHFNSNPGPFPRYSTISGQKPDEYGLADFAVGLLTLSDVDDVTVVVTFATRKGHAIHIDGQPAEKYDTPIATAGLFMPFVGGRLAGKVFFNAKDAVRYALNHRDYGAKVADAVADRRMLRGNLGLKLGDETVQAHHLMPVELVEESPLLRQAIDEGFDFNGATNGMALVPYSAADDVGEHATHPRYTEQIRQKLLLLQKEGYEGTAREAVEKVVGDVRKALEANRGKKINEVDLGL